MILEYPAMKRYYTRMLGLSVVITALCISACGNPPAPGKPDDQKESTYLKKSLDKAKDSTESVANRVSEEATEERMTAGE